MTKQFHTYHCWYVDCEAHPHVYGYTMWEVTFDPYHNDARHPDGSRSWSHGYNNLQFSLVSTDSGSVTRTDLFDLIKNHRGSDSCKPSDYLIFDNIPEMVSLSEQVSKAKRIDSERISLAERTGTVSEQILRYGSVLNKGRYVVDDMFMTYPDLIFDDCGSVNLIDPMTSDMMVSFPLTQSLLIACHALAEQANKGRYRGGGGAVGAPRYSKRFLTGYGSSRGIRDFLDSY